MGQDEVARLRVVGPLPHVGVAVEAGEPVEVGFRPDGTARACRLVFSGKDGEQLELWIDAALGQARIREPGE